MVRKEQVMKSTTTTVLVAAGALLVGGIATAAFMKSGDKSPDSISAGTPNGESRLVEGNALTTAHVVTSWTRPRRAGWNMPTC
jgi:hypothetical protein